MKISVVRHTRVELDGSIYCYGQTDVMPVETFEEEAEGTRLVLRGQTFDGVFTSPLTRAKMLAHYLGYQDAIEDARLKEMNFGEWEMLQWSDIIPQGVAVDEFFEVYITKRTPNGESLMDQYSRVKDFLDEKKAEGYQHILVFCHGGVINNMRAIVGEVPLQDSFAFLPDFASVTELTY